LSAAPAPELDAEQEVDFARYWRALITRWWLLLLGVIAGAIIGFLATLGGGTSYNATAEVYLGQPLAPGGSAQVSSVPTQLGLVANLATSDSTLRTVAAKVGLPVSKLRGNVSAKPIAGVTGAKVGTPAPLLNITVTGTPRAKVAAAANAIAEIVIAEVSPYQGEKIKNLIAERDYDNAQIKLLAENLVRAQANQAQILKDKTISATDKLIVLGNLNSVITLAQQRSEARHQDLFQVEQQLTLARQVEASRIVSHASGTPTAGPSRRSGVIVGAVIGLILGILAALLFEPLSRSWSRASASQS
jgi:capsular polysaccharide biosynthesis protein